MEKYRILQKTALCIFILITMLILGCSHGVKQYRPAFDNSSIEPIPYEDEEAYYNDEESDESEQRGFFNKMAPIKRSHKSQESCDDEFGSLSEDQKLSAEEQKHLDAAIENCEKAQQMWKEDQIDEAVNFLDQAYTNIMEVGESENPEVIRQIEEIRVLISKRFIEIYSSKFTTAKGTHDEIPITVNHHVEAELNLFQTAERSFFVNAYNRSGLYHNMIVKKLKEAGLPEELSWLPLIESGYKVRALSPARALGMWQFIPSTGYKYGLMRDRFIDERMDPEKATDAAISYMKEMHEMFGDWMTVLAGYNCGEGRVLRVIREQKINYLDNFWDLYERLPRETARYVPRFLATLAVVKDPQKYGFHELGDPHEPVEYEVINVDRQARLQDIASYAGLNLGDLELLNPELRLKVTPPSGYSLKVPTKIDQTILASINSIPTTPVYSAPVEQQSERRYAKKSSKPKYSRYHKVKRGETLASVSRMYNTSIKSIKAINKISRSNHIYVGQKLRIPGSAKLSTKYARSSKSKSKVKSYKVRRGDTLWSVAKRYGTTTKAIKQINKIRGNCLIKGQVIRIPQG